jgi:DnaJ-class molecular chaperone
MSTPTTPIPLDPADQDKLPPADVDACSRCDGTGGIFPTLDPQDVQPCPVCGGDGVLPELGGAA